MAKAALAPALPRRERQSLVRLRSRGSSAPVTQARPDTIWASWHDAMIMMIVMMIPCRVRGPGGGPRC